MCKPKPHDDKTSHASLPEALDDYERETAANHFGDEVNVDENGQVPASELAYTKG